MKTLHAAWLGTLALMIGAASASEPPRDLEPAVDTSAPSRAPQAPSSSTAPAAASAATPAPRATRGAAKNASAPDAARSTSAPAAAVQSASAPRGKVLDRLNLDETQVTGNSELPKVLYIVPWKRADLGDLNGKPMNSLLDEVLTPIDRDVFRRENRYYDALETRQAAPASQGTRDEK